jgi:S-adenosyl methyltransferase
VNPHAAHPVPGAIDVTRPHPARMYDYYLGGKDHWPADKQAADKVLAAVPEVRAIARANRGFLRRAVTHLARDKGITQFLDVGTGIPTSPNVHETATACAPGARVVYADNDPVIHAHANALLTGTGTTRIILADLRDPDVILAGARNFLDFTKPVALLLVAIMHFIPDADDPAGIVAAYRDALPPGSFLALSHGTGDFHDAEVAGAATSTYDTATAPLVLRPKAAIAALLDGFKPEPPGLVQAPLWHPDTTPKPRDLKKIGIYAAVAAKDQPPAPATAPD